MKSQSLTTVRAYSPTGAVTNETLELIQKAFIDAGFGSAFIDGQTVEIVAGLTHAPSVLADRDIIRQFDAMFNLSRKLCRSNIFVKGVFRLTDTFGSSSQTEYKDGGLHSIESFGFFVSDEVRSSLPASFTYHVEYPFFEISLHQSLQTCENSAIDGKIIIKGNHVNESRGLYNILHDVTYVRHIYLNSLDAFTDTTFKKLSESTWQNLKRRYPSLTSHLENNSDITSMGPNLDWARQISINI